MNGKASGEGTRTAREGGDRGEKKTIKKSGRKKSLNWHGEKKGK